MEKDIPAIIPEVSGLKEKGEACKDSAKGDIEDLSFFDKAKCVKAIAMNMKEVARLPAYIQNCLENLKKELEDMLATMKKLNSDLDKILTGAETCIKKKTKDAPDCYREVYGPIQ